MLDFLKSASTPPNDLLGIIRYVRARWRARLAVKGSVRLLAVNVGVFFALAYLMQWSRFTPASILFSRLVLAAAPYKIALTPGNVSVPKGADQTINAKLSGFSAQNAVVMLRRDPTSQTYEKLPLVLNDKGVFEGIIFGVKTATEYFVDADGVKSGTFTLKVVDVPYVDKLALEYKFPAYTGLDPEKIEDGGDIAVLRGTDVKVTITPTMKTKGGRIALNDKDTVPLL